MARDSRRDKDYYGRDDDLSACHVCCGMRTLHIFGIWLTNGHSDIAEYGRFDFYLPNGTSSVGAGLHVSPKGWVYAAIIVPLTFITMLLACLWMRWTERNAGHQAVEVNTGKGSIAKRNRSRNIYRFTSRNSSRPFENIESKRHAIVCKHGGG
jgi:hypothetical protein